jgi:hydrogenase large subunit
VDKINEYVRHSWYEDGSSGLNPKDGKTVIQLQKSNGYSFAKSPRYEGKPHEVGPLARMWIANPVISKHANKFLGLPAEREVRFRDLGEKAFSVLGRLAARAEEGWVEIQAMKKWVPQIKLKEPVYVKAEVPERGEGYGLTEAPRGSVGHWIRISGKMIANYQVIAPTSWNVSPRDDKGIPGPIEQALIGTPVPDPANPVNVMRVIHSFDP